MIINIQDILTDEGLCYANTRFCHPHSMNVYDALNVEFKISEWINGYLYLENSRFYPENHVEIILYFDDVDKIRAPLMDSIINAVSYSFRYYFHHNLSLSDYVFLTYEKYRFNFYQFFDMFSGISDKVIPHDRIKVNSMFECMDIVNKKKRKRNFPSDYVLDKVLVK